MHDCEGDKTVPCSACISQKVKKITHGLGLIVITGVQVTDRLLALSTMKQRIEVLWITVVLSNSKIHHLDSCFVDSNYDDLRVLSTAS